MFTSFDGEFKVQIDEYALNYGRRAPVLQRLDAYKQAKALNMKFYQTAIFMGGISIISFDKESSDFGPNIPIEELLDECKKKLQVIKDQIVNLRVVVL